MTIPAVGSTHQGRSGAGFVISVAVLLICNAFEVSNAFVHSSSLRNFHSANAATVTRLWSTAPKYIPPPPEETPASVKKKKKPASLHPKIGDVVRYYDIDGGRADGEVLVGKISYIAPRLEADTTTTWLIDLSELEDVGDGYYAEYPSRQRNFKKATRTLQQISPIAASFVRSENAYKIPRKADGGVLVRAEQYDIDDYAGPFTEPVNQQVVEDDAAKYQSIKLGLLRNAALTGLAGAIGTDLLRGTQDAIIFAAGALASVAYLFFLSLKTDTIASADSKLGKNVSNLRFLMPVLVIVGVALYNQSLGDANPVQSDSPLDTITTEQFAAAILGFLTYRIPLFLSQIQEAFQSEDGDMVLPGSAGVAMKLASGEATDENKSALSLTSAEDLTTVLLVSGPQATGRSELVKQFLQEGDERFVEPKPVDRFQDGATFERLQQRGDFLFVDSKERYGITKESIVKAASEGTGSVVVIDADVEYAKRLSKVPGLRLVGVWVGLNSVKEFQNSIEQKIDSGEIVIVEDETKESTIRGKTREIVQEIEYGISSGIFEFTILNNDVENSLKELREAASYCFK